MMSTIVFDSTPSIVVVSLSTGDKALVVNKCQAGVQGVSSHDIRYASIL